MFVSVSPDITGCVSSSTCTWIGQPACPSTLKLPNPPSAGTAVSVPAAPYEQPNDMYIPVLVPLAAKLMALRVRVSAAVPSNAAGSAWKTGSVPTTVNGPVTAGDHFAVVLAAVASPSPPSNTQCGSGKTIALNAPKSAVVLPESDHH